MCANCLVLEGSTGSDDACDSTAADDGFSPVPVPDAETAADDSGQSCPMQSCI